MKIEEILKKIEPRVIMFLLVGIVLALSIHEEDLEKKVEILYACTLGLWTLVPYRINKIEEDEDEKT